MENNSLVFLLNKHLISSKCWDTWFSRGGQDFSNESVQGGEYAEADIKLLLFTFMHHMGVPRIEFCHPFQFSFLPMSL